jgi:hypothetical protein
MDQSYITGRLEIPLGSIPVISTKWSWQDYFNTVKVRWSIGRMNYTFPPGIYAVGSPGRDSRVFVTGNFKLSLDHLRRALDGMNAWILVLNTKGINVWCAAGKKTFSTRELVNRIQTHKLSEIVSHRKVILPQLGATGVAAHKVKEESGFSVIYGPVRSGDIKEFVNAGLKATTRMRTVYFPLRERLKLIPVEFFYAKYYLLLVPSVFFILAGFSPRGYSLDASFFNGGKAVLNLFSGYLAGCAITPALLPWIPVRRFSLKGLITGIIIATFLTIAGTLGKNIFEIISWFLMMGGISSFMAMNFTGSSTFTSLSGVQKEMKTALPLQIVVTSAGLIIWLITRFV